MWSVWDAPSDRDYYDQFNPFPNEDEESMSTFHFRRNSSMRPSGQFATLHSPAIATKTAFPKSLTSMRGYSLRHIPMPSPLRRALLVGL